MADTHWKTYEEVATCLLNKCHEEFLLAGVEGKQEVAGKSGTKWKIDAKGVFDGSDAIVIIECRRHTTQAIDQEQVGGVAYRIRDTGAVGGLIVSPLGFQEGAELVANDSRIFSVKLHKDSTPTEFAMNFLHKIFMGIHERLDISDTCDVEEVRAVTVQETLTATDSCRASVTHTCDLCHAQFPVVKSERICPICSSDG